MTNFKPMLAAKANPDKLKFPLYVQPKLDGIRCAIVNGRALTRTLKDVPNAEIRKALSRSVFEGLDGELIVGDPTAKDCYRRTCSFVMAADKTGEPWAFHVFDVWNSRLSFERREALLLTQRPLQAHFVHVASQLVANAQELEALEASFVRNGHEGAILRDPNATYKFGRASATKGELLKLKRFEDFEAVVVGVYEEQHNANEATTNALGRTERSSAQSGKIGKGTLGGLVLRALNGRFAGVEFRCGTGFDAVMRQNYWEHQYQLPGRIAKIKHFPLGAKDKPRFPTFLGWRDERDM